MVLFWSALALIAISSTLLVTVKKSSEGSLKEALLHGKTDDYGSSDFNCYEVDSETRAI